MSDCAESFYTTLLKFSSKTEGQIWWTFSTKF